MVRIKAEFTSFKRVATDAVACLVHEDDGLFRDTMKDLRAVFGRRIDAVIERRSFKGKEGEVLGFDSQKGVRAPWFILVGLGKAEQSSLEQYRRAAASAAGEAKHAHCSSLAIVPPAHAGKKCPVAPEQGAAALAEGAYLSLYAYDKYISKKEKKTKLTDVTILSPTGELERAFRKEIHDALIGCQGTLLARDLENAPPNELYPETLAAAAQEAAKRDGFKCTVWDKKKIEQMGFGGLLGVSSGSNRPARFIILEHNAGRKDLKTVVIVGKGVTFDAGGISIKPASGMSEMKMDMSGAAAVLGTLTAAARLKLPVHLVGLMPATENLLGGSAMRPGDIITHYGGTTSEVDNTDAEGRLILADALAYASTFQPDVVIDLATLTGACVVALGMHATGMMGNDADLMGALKTAGEKTYERVWELPLYEEYEKQIKSDVADVKNVGGRWAGAITAALFLKKFVGKQKWVHLDIAGTAILEEALPYAPKGGSGVGVRLLVEYLKNLA